ncbi:MAG: carboxyl transferase domain-containing protein [bacterium]|nr:carboxyl transferase domain-containing protein [bacterium]
MNISRKYSLTEIHESAASYQKIKAKHVIAALYREFVPYHALPDFPQYIQAPAGHIIELVPDPAMIIGEATFLNTRVCIVAQQTPSSDEDRSKLNYGLVKADGYGLALNMMSYAETHNRVLHTWIDTVGGDPFEYSAEKLQSWLISYCQEKMINLATKSVSVILGRGGSGGAIALQLAHHRLMLQLAEYSVIAAEGCASIISREVTPQSVASALEMLRPSADNMLKYGIIDEIIAEPLLANPDYLAITLRNIEKALASATGMVTRFDVRYLREELLKKINACGGIGKRPFYKDILPKTKRLISHLRPKKKIVSDEVALMREAFFRDSNYEPFACNDERDPKEDLKAEVVRHGCHTISEEQNFLINHSSCPTCNRPQTLTPEEYIELLLDSDSFHELHEDLTCEHIDARFDFFDYADSRKKAVRSSYSKEALVIGHGKLHGLPITVAISDFSFMGGSLGSVVGEKIRLICDYAAQQQIPLISITATGGARMQEGTVALYQMAKTVAAISQLKKQELPFISILGHPTTGGTLASYAVLGDFILAETKATVRFAGHRVVKLTSGGRSMKTETTSSDFFARLGGIHIALQRSQIKQMTYSLLTLTPWHKTHFKNQHTS